MSAGARLVRPPEIRRSRVKQGEASEPCKARGRNRANVRLHVRGKSAGARLVRPPKIRRSLVKQRDPVRGRAPRAPSSRPGSARGRGFRRPSAGPFFGGSPALDRRSAGPRRGLPERPRERAQLAHYAARRPRPLHPRRCARKARLAPFLAASHWLFTTEMHPITLGGNRGFLGARIGSRPTLRRLCAEKSPTAAPIGRSEASTIAPPRAPGARAATKSGGAHNACPRRHFPNVQPDKCRLSNPTPILCASSDNQSLFAAEIVRGGT